MTAVQSMNIIAALPPWAAGLVWILAIVGAIVFVYRRVTGAGRAPAAPADDAALPSPSDTAASSTPSAFFVEPTPDRPGIPLANPPTDGRAPVPPAPVDEVTGPTGAVLPTDLTASGAPEPAATGASGRTGFFAPAAGSEGTPAAETRRLTVAEALRGVSMPSGLSPVVDGSVSIPNPFRVAFLTTSADASTVGSSVGDELERLGYALTTSTATELLARKPGVELRVVLYPAPDKATRGLDHLFPVAPPGSVGVEFST